MAFFVCAISAVCRRLGRTASGVVAPDALGAAAAPVSAAAIRFAELGPASAEPRQQSRASGTLWV